jgi:hypothetical protein
MKAFSGFLLIAVMFFCGRIFVDALDEEGNYDSFFFEKRNSSAIFTNVTEDFNWEDEEKDKYLISSS